MAELDDLILKLGEGTLTRPEAERMLQLLREYPGVEPPVDMLAAVSGAAGAGEEKVRRRVYAKISRRISPYRSRLFALPLRLAVAATVLMVLSLGAWAIASQSGEPQTITARTGYGEVQQIILPDGSEVTLHANTLITYREIWADDEDREVIFRGEAHFRVAEKTRTGQKFRVVTPDLAVEVLGTVFTVSTYEKKTTVALEEGKVEVDVGDPTIGRLQLQPGEQLSYSLDRRELDRPHLRQEDETWRNGYMSFANVTLEEICLRLGATYGIDYTIHDSVAAGRVFTLSLPAKDLKSALRVLAASTGLTVSYRSGKVHVRTP